MKHIYFFVVFVASVCIGHSQPVTTQGTDFWLTFMQNSEIPARRIFVSAYQPSKVTISIGGTVVRTQQLGANSWFAYDVDDTKTYLETSSTLCVGCAVRVQATTPVTVYAYNTIQTSTDASVVLPTQTLGNSYRVASYPSGQSKSEDWASLFSIVGVESQSVVEIIPSADMESNTGSRLKKNERIEVNLRAGDVIQYKSFGIGTDLSGTTVRLIGPNSECGKLAVFSGHQRTGIPSNGNTGRDHLFEQIPPISSWGREYILPNLEGATEYDVAVFASEANTDFAVDNYKSNLVSATSFAYRKDLDATKSHVIQASKPVLVVLYAHSGDAGWRNNGMYGDPFMVVIPPIEQRVDKTTLYAFTPNNQRGWSDNTFLTLVTPKANRSLVLIDGYSLGSLPATIGSLLSDTDVDGNYSSLVVKLRSGVRTVDASKNGGVLALLHGIAEVDSYGFVAGAKVTNLRTDISANTPPFCPGRPVTLIGYNDDSVNVIDWQWVFHDGKTANGKVVSRSYPDTGTYYVKLIMPKVQCGADTAYYTVRVTNPLRTRMKPKRVITCIDSLVRYTVSVDPPGQYTYEWKSLNGSAGIVSGSTDSVIVVQQKSIGTFSYEVTVTDANGCLGRDTAELQVVTPPRVTGVQRLYACPGEDVVITPTIEDTARVTVEWDARNPLHRSNIIGDRRSRQITVRSSEPGDYDYVVTAKNVYGCAESMVFTVTVVEQPQLRRSTQAVVFSCLDDNSPPVDLGNDITVTGGVPPFTYTWSEVGGGTGSFIGPTDRLVTQVKPKKTTRYILTVRDANTIRQCPVQLEVTVELRPVPDANAGPDALFCACSPADGATIGLEARCGIPPYKYSWSPTGGLSNPSSSLTATTQAKPSSTTAYVLTVTDATGAADKDTVTVVVAPCPEFLVSPVTAKCDTDTVYILDPRFAGDTAGYRYQWEPSSGIDNPVSATATVRMLNRTERRQYSLTVTSPLGCTTTRTLVVRHSAGVTVDASADRNCNGGAICRGEDVHLKASVVGGIQPYSFVWSTSSSSVGTGPTLTQQPLRSTMYYVRVTDSVGCSSIDSVEVCVDPVPNVRIGHDTTICANEAFSSSLIRGDSSTCGKPPFLYRWEPSALVDIPNQNRPWRAVLRPAGPMTFYLRVTDDGGRGVTTTDSLVVSVRERIRLTRSNDSVEYCDGDVPPALSVESSLGNAPYTTQFALGGTSTPSYSVDSPGRAELPAEHLPIQPGRYVVYVNVRDATNCRVQDSIIVRVNTRPVVSISGRKRICLCDTVQLTAVIDNPQGSYSYQWNEFSEDAPSGTTTITTRDTRSIAVRPSYSTTYSVIVIDSHGCADTAQFAVDVRSVSADVRFRIDSILADPRSPGVPIRIVTVRTTDSIGCNPDAVSVTLLYDANLYDPNPWVTPGVITGNRLVDSLGVTWRQVTAEIRPIRDLRNSTTLAEFHGKALVGAPGETVLGLRDVQLIYLCDQVKGVGINGALALDSLCETTDSLRRMLRFNVDVLSSIYPNPTSDDVVTATFVKRSGAMSLLRLVDLAGRVLWQQHIDAAIGSIQKIAIPTPNGAGVYEVLLHSDGYWSSATIVVH
jgi:hypothetical protein